MKYFIFFITIFFLCLIASPIHKFNYKIYTKTGVYYLDTLRNENGRFYYINSDNKKWYIDSIISIEVN